MKFKNYALVAFFYFICTFILGLMVSHFIPAAQSIRYFWIAIGVGVGRFFIEWFKDKFSLKIK
jgi:hypothetical protein